MLKEELRSASFLTLKWYFKMKRKKNKKKETGSGQLETDSRKAPVGIQRGHLEFFRPQVHEHEVCRVTDRQAQSCGKSPYLQPCWTKPGRAQHLKTWWQCPCLHSMLHTKAFLHKQGVAFLSRWMIPETHLFVPICKHRLNEPRFFLFAWGNVVGFLIYMTVP